MEAPATDHRKATAERNVQAILDAAENLLAEHGQASVSAVAAAAGLSRVTVYAHFPAPEDLLEAVVRRAVEATARVLAAARLADGPPDEALGRLLALGWRELDHYRTLAAAALSQLSPDALTRSHRSAHDQVRQLVVRGQQDGSFRAGLPADWLVTSCFALIHACAGEVRAGRLAADDGLGVLTASVRALVGAPMTAPEAS